MRRKYFCPQCRHCADALDAERRGIRSWNAKRFRVIPPRYESIPMDILLNSVIRKARHGTRSAGKLGLRMPEMKPLVTQEQDDDIRRTVHRFDRNRFRRDDSTECTLGQVSALSFMEAKSRYGLTDRQVVAVATALRHADLCFTWDKWILLLAANVAFQLKDAGDLELEKYSGPFSHKVRSGDLQQLTEEQGCEVAEIQE